MKWQYLVIWNILSVPSVFNFLQIDWERCFQSIGPAGSGETTPSQETSMKYFTLNSLCFIQWVRALMVQFSPFHLCNFLFHLALFSFSTKPSLLCFSSSVWQWILSVANCYKVIVNTQFSGLSNCELYFTYKKIIIYNSRP